MVDAAGRHLARHSGLEYIVEQNANLQAGYKLTKSVRLALDIFNLFNTKDSDIDYYYASRLPGEPAAGVDDIHFHPALPRTARLSLHVAF